MNRLRVVIVDDEDAARKAVRLIIEQNFDQIEIVGEAFSVNGAIVEIETKRPDLLLLDIEIVGGTGFDVLSQMYPHNMRVIFITAFNDFAIRAFKFSAVDYVLKPVVPEDLIMGIKKVLDADANQYKSQMQIMQYNQNNMLKKIAIPTLKGLFFTPIDQIEYCMADNTYTIIYLQNMEKKMVSKNLKHFEELLSPHNFYRVHQSYLVNLNSINSFSHDDGGVLFLANGTRIPISRRRKDKLLQLLRS